jgi:hypothetical protein
LSATKRCFPDGQAVADFLGWLPGHQLGRKRLLDTQLAASLCRAGVKRFVTNIERDFRLLGDFRIVHYRC